MMGICNAILRFHEDKFIMCELEEGHKGNHKGLMFEWKENNQQTNFTIWARGLNLLKIKTKNKKENF